MKVREMLQAMKVNCGWLSPLLPLVVPGVVPICIRDRHRGGCWISLKALRCGVNVSKTDADAITRPAAMERPIANVPGRRWNGVKCLKDETNRKKKPTEKHEKKAKQLIRIDWAPST